MWYEVGYKLLVLLAACCCCRWTACYPQTSPFYDDRGHTAPRPRGGWGGSLSIRCQGPPPLLSPTHLISRLPSPPPDSRQEARCPLSHIASSTTFKTDIKVTSCHLCTFHARNTLMVFFQKGRNTHTIHCHSLRRPPQGHCYQSQSKIVLCRIMPTTT